MHDLRPLVLLVTVLALLVACSDDDGGSDATVSEVGAPADTTTADGVPEASEEVTAEASAPDTTETIELDTLEPEVTATDTTPAPLDFVVMTFNAGTTGYALHDKDEEEGEGDGYTSAHAAIIADHLGNSLAWVPAEEAVAAFFEAHSPDVVAMQELLYDPRCEGVEIPAELSDLSCADWTPDKELQLARLLGDGYQIACADGYPDNCIAVKKTFGTIEGCPMDEPCLGGLVGTPVEGCSSGARIASALVTLTDGRTMVVVDVHTNAGMEQDDFDCRVAQMKQIFEDRGDGIPAAYGEVNLVMGDFNTDPFLLYGAEPSATYLGDTAGGGGAFHFVSSSDASGPPTHSSTLHIDHVISDALVGSCVVPGETDGIPLVMETSYFDHRPVLCDVTLP